MDIPRYLISELQILLENKRTSNLNIQKVHAQHVAPIEID